MGLRRFNHSGWLRGLEDDRQSEILFALIPWYAVAPEMRSCTSGSAVAGNTGPKWKFVVQERAEFAIWKSSDSGDDKSFSDITTLAGRVEWVVRGREYARRACCERRT